MGVSVCLERAMTANNGKGPPIKDVCLEGEGGG